MSKRFMDPKGKLLVAVNFDEAAPRLLELAKEISSRTGLGMRLVHVVEPTLREVYPGTLDITGAIRDAADEIDETNTKEARERLYQYERDYLTPPPTKARTPEEAIKIERVVLVGEAAEAIIAEATLNGAALILCGAGSKHRHFVPIGYSTPLSLMAQAPCPVLIQTSQCSHTVGKGRVKLLVADDLSPRGLDALLTGLDVARALGHTDVLHLTVSPTAQGWYLALKERLTGGESDENRAKAQEHLDNLTARLEAKLKERAPEHVALLNTGDSTYKTAVLKGADVAQEVQKGSQDFAADIVVYGRHQTLHKHPWTLGKVAWHEMLQGERLVLVAPAT